MGKNKDISQDLRKRIVEDLKAPGIEASEHMISRALHREDLHSRTPRKTPLLQKRHVKARLKNHEWQEISSYTGVAIPTSARLLKLKRGWKFQQDNDAKHTANETKEWLRMKELNILEWHSQSLDMNPIENLWRELKLKIQKRDPSNINELKEIVIEEGNKITPETCKRLAVNYYKRLEAIINNKGYAMK
ncbi:Transposase Tc1-like [Trinorchestia longiramus]|nr:Transposase Tc1-like [Trinorchestia longiramus]